MSRGNQREVDQQRAQAKLKSKKQAKDGRPEARNLKDAGALQAKVALKQKQMEEKKSEGNVNRTVVKPKKKKAPKESLDDLLNAGLKKK
mmetsp:Transcript_3703/g.6875  ORF Transcript_3703/g.6875 Transcript_3703/m.6875 type:complete len:89 (-) Transcript_3703:322-588(-)|eukprot:CAMPEP_0113309544 /NCGR_PEP_ID=MMETSP0010_2-20120614/7543_1 /TAXON_ID=216773 ORGANISM="Corethron hystrix, Strain 308" /NCGR_SAMPLE_ID=MMETSP0010_2 /ASSEMBLY_ACC=CAM_ASM_000155 /LENGTH=88 /DNA_ID=CAMNT_0000164813 /DNA_START=118 /DNA_END=384 /DNA_ORIENTATION=- /assembly_acc=CAM_ASM_000155